MSSYVAPARGEDAFNCPHCGAFAMQLWHSIHINVGGRYPELPEWAAAACTRCKRHSVWLGQKMIIPISGISPLPHPDMPKDVSEIYSEARNIYNQSPKGAAALLRLALQRLCVDLGQEGENINNAIGELVKKGLPIEIQQALDVVRVVGNNAVHPGEIVLDDSPEVAGTLFDLINYIVDRMISQPKKVSELFDQLPAGAVEAIKKRDGAS